MAADLAIADADIDRDRIAEPAFKELDDRIDHRLERGRRTVDASVIGNVDHERHGSPPAKEAAKAAPLAYRPFVSAHSKFVERDYQSCFRSTQKCVRIRESF